MLRAARFMDVLSGRTRMQAVCYGFGYEYPSVLGSGLHLSVDDNAKGENERVLEQNYI